MSDRTVTLADSEKFEAHPFTKTNSNVSATYLLMQGLALSAGYAWEDWKRDPEVRNIEKTSEKTPRVSIDYTAPSWFSLRASYFSGSRRGNTPYTEAATEILNFRRFDEADRDRTRVSLASSLMPTDAVTIGLTLETGNDKFPHSQYGVQNDKSLDAGHGRRLESERAVRRERRLDARGREGQRQLSGTAPAPWDPPRTTTRRTDG